MSDTKNMQNTGINFTPIPDPNDPTKFTVSEEDAAKIRAIAMENSNIELNQEIANTLGASTDYEQSKSIIYRFKRNAFVTCKRNI